MEGRTAYGQHMTVFWSRAKHHVTTSLMTIMLACQTMLPQNSLWNKCIGDDTKAAAHQSLNRIKKIKDGEKWFLIWRIEFLHPSMWHVALKSWQWIHQVVAPCNVICGSGMTFHWIRTNVRHIGILHLVSISTHHRSRHVILFQSAKFYPNQTTLGRKKWRHVDFQDDGSQGSNCRDPVVGIQ